MTRYILAEGEALLLVAVFDHLKPYYKQAKGKHTSVAEEMSKADGEIIEPYFELYKEAIIKALTPRERKVITQRFGLSVNGKPRALEEVGREFGVTRERIRQVEAKALKKIKRYMTEFNDEETNMIIRALEIQAQEELKNSAQAQEQGDSVSEEVYTHNWMVDTAVESKLRIQQAIRKYRDPTEWNGVERSRTE